MLSLLVYNITRRALRLSSNESHGGDETRVAFIHPLLLPIARPSCTTEVTPYTFDHDAVTVTLVDTPGSNDTTHGETEVLRDIAEWLDITYRNPPSIKLSGIIYMQSIGDNRMYGSSLRNLKMFRDLCGEKPMKNVIFATTGWRLAKNARQFERAVERETQLCTERLFWEPMIRFGADTARFEGRRESGLNIIKKLIPQPPVVLQIQHELLNQDKNLIDTTAGATVNEEIKRLEAHYQHQLREIQREMTEALTSSDLEHQQALEETKATIEYLREQTRQACDILNHERRTWTADTRARCKACRSRWSTRARHWTTNPAEPWLRPQPNGMKTKCASSR
ncbi:hypothetical protein ABEF95_005510 [Exophiala dermatitidis]